MDRYYFDNAATTPIRKEVLDAMIPVLSSGYGNPSSIHAEGRAIRALLESARKTVGTCIGASTSEIFFTSGGTESNNTAIKCAVRDLGVKRIITSRIEHHCGLHTSEAMEKHAGIEVVWLPVDKLGRINYQDLESALKASDITTLVSLMHANNEIGTMIDLEKVALICKAHHAYFHSDTVQTIGHFPLDVSKFPIHFLSGAAHKFHGPKGVGFLYISGKVKINPFIDGGSQERNMRGGTENVYGIVGLAKALELAVAEMEMERKQISYLREYMIRKLNEQIPGVEYNGDYTGASLYTVLSVSFPETEKSEMLLFLLDMSGISVSGGSACSSGSDKGSHVLEAIGVPSSRKTIRFSFSRFNNLQEVDYVVDKLKELVSAQTQKALVN